MTERMQAVVRAMHETTPKPAAHADTTGLHLTTARQDPDRIGRWSHGLSSNRHQRFLKHLMNACAPAEVSFRLYMDGELQKSGGDATAKNGPNGHEQTTSRS
jgi:hypothetical protein